MKLKDWTVDILSKRFTVKWQTVTGKDFGSCDSVKCEIKVDPKAHIEQQKDTLLHEILHALDHELDTRMTERQIRLMATGLLPTARANPEIFKWLMER